MERYRIGAAWIEVGREMLKKITVLTVMGLQSINIDDLCHY